MGGGLSSVTLAHRNAGEETMEHGTRTGTNDSTSGMSADARVMLPSSSYGNKTHTDRQEVSVSSRDQRHGDA